MMSPTGSEMSFSIGGTGTTHPKNRCIRCGTGEVKQRTAKDGNVCTWCRVGDSDAYHRLKACQEAS